MGVSGALVKQMMFHHLLRHCLFTSVVWWYFLNPFATQLAMPVMVCASLEKELHFSGFTDSKLWRFSLVAVLCPLWPEQNNSTFHNRLGSMIEVSWKAQNKVTSWALAMKQLCGLSTSDLCRCWTTWCHLNVFDKFMRLGLHFWFLILLQSIIHYFHFSQ